MTFADCEGCPNLTKTEEGYTCERYVTDDISRINYCDDVDNN